MERLGEVRPPKQAFRKQSSEFDDVSFEFTGIRTDVKDVKEEVDKLLDDLKQFDLKKEQARRPQLAI